MCQEWFSNVFLCGYVILQYKNNCLKQQQAFIQMSYNLLNYVILLFCNYWLSTTWKRTSGFYSPAFIIQQYCFVKCLFIKSSRYKNYDAVHDTNCCLDRKWRAVLYTILIRMSAIVENGLLAKSSQYDNNRLTKILSM